MAPISEVSCCTNQAHSSKNPSDYEQSEIQELIPLIAKAQIRRVHLNYCFSSQGSNNFGSNGYGGTRGYSVWTHSKRSFISTRRFACLLGCTIPTGCGITRLIAWNVGSGNTEASQKGQRRYVAQTKFGLLGFCRRRTYNALWEFLCGTAVSVGWM